MKGGMGWDNADSQARPPAKRNPSRSPMVESRSRSTRETKSQSSSHTLPSLSLHPLTPPLIPPFTPYRSQAGAIRPLELAILTLISCIQLRPTFPLMSSLSTEV